MAASTGTMLISRCICRNVEFSELLPRARAAGWSLLDLVGQTGCGGQCGLCRPYLSRMLRTGETEFHEILTADER
jgi:bacterioferritin-associated ferredoxin